VLILRSSQIVALEELALATFERRMVEHLREFSPPLTGRLPEEELTAFVRGGIERAEGYGFTLQGPAQLYLETMVLLGSEFTNDPMYPWAAPPSPDDAGDAGDEEDRAFALYDRLLDYGVQVDGDDNRNTRAALMRVGELADAPREFSHDGLEDVLRDELSRVYPEKAEYIGAEALREVVERGIATAVRLDPGCEARTIGIVCLLMFGLGHGAPRDPLHRWIGRILGDRTLEDRAARAALLEQTARTWLGQALAWYGGPLP